MQESCAHILVRICWLSIYTCNRIEGTQCSPLECFINKVKTESKTSKWLNPTWSYAQILTHAYIPNIMFNTTVVFKWTPLHIYTFVRNYLWLDHAWLHWCTKFLYKSSTFDTEWLYGGEYIEVWRLSSWWTSRIVDKGHETYYEWKADSMLVNKIRPHQHVKMHERNYNTRTQHLSSCVEALTSRFNCCLLVHGRNVLF